jgi:hypothetical protein
MDFEEDDEERSEIAPTVILRPESVYSLLLPEELLLLTISFATVDNQNLSDVFDRRIQCE